MTHGNGHAPAKPSPAPSVDLSLLEPALAKYRHQRGALIPLLQAAQELYGYLPREALEAIARATGSSISKVYGVATFYAQFYLQPRGRHVLKVCDGTACHVKGTPKLLTAVHDTYRLEPGKTTEDGQLTLEIVYCLGSCALAPVAVLDGQVLGHLQQDALVQRLRRVIGQREPASHDR